MGWFNDFTDYSLNVVNQYRPKLEIYGGTAMILGSSAYACYKTTQLKDVNDMALKRVEMVHEKYDNAEIVDEKEYKKEVAKARIKQVGEIAGLYALPIAGICVGTGLIIDGVNTYDNRLYTSMAYANSLLAFINEYRKRTKEEIGEEKEENIYHNAAKKDKEDRENRDISESPYTRLWAETCCTGWDPNPEVSRNTLLCVQANANDIIQSRKRSLGYGWMYLNEVLEMLGYPLTDEGQDVGWFIDPDGMVGNLEGFIDFGIKRPINARFLASGSGEVLEQNCWLDFNCCGNIRPLMFRTKNRRPSSVYGH